MYADDITTLFSDEYAKIAHMNLELCMEAQDQHYVEVVHNRLFKEIE